MHWLFVICCWVIIACFWAVNFIFHNVKRRFDPLCKNEDLNLHVNGRFDTLIWVGPLMNLPTSHGLVHLMDLPIFHGLVHFINLPIFHGLVR